MIHFRDVLRKKYPQTAERAATGSRAAAMKLMCMECVGGSIADVFGCTDAGCWLYPFRPVSRASSSVAKIDTQTPSGRGSTGQPVPEGQGTGGGGSCR